ncbi:putative nuclear RNA binding protein [Aspergillus clavatus NRRL 1]|uniref:Nuclear RNA binding protein, putative n=1 Tax=Aspergillus clavatus (strain ATCC 1007 / CBS 513.65 / DSM 816 / NCTC 3887 / NRRL 1 / QM 1276 / 107) TaxID=344612 RepID=A1CPK6_ASPCL|nr:nuclear RNA binding protein, putative [Aspergillus clavatus NRRL 1]EAW07577.1 nuclear RNA binding protein, putative [Aspergillus clavatus NRRL 1]
MSCAQVHLDSDPLQADRQLQQAVHSTYQRSDSKHHSHSRKHSRTSTVEDSDWPSDESGRFDDAEEVDNIYPQPTGSPDTHSAKRGRSNDWPLQPGEEPSSASQKEQHGSSHRWPFKNLSHGSPRRHARQAGGSTATRGRRSRFVEAHMNDSVSERPPSIFLREDAGPAGANGAGQRQSGIFRFGKAIASAFNPFGVWGNVSEIWRNSPAEQRPELDARAQAEKAYAELKKAGYRGAVKGSYLQSVQGSGYAGDPLHRASQEQWDGTKTVGRHSRQSSGDGYVSGSSIRTSFQELRKAKSSLGMSYIKRGSEDSEQREVRKSKSRKELQRQAKLRKRVSDLEGKLERARRELRELTGEEEEEPVRTLCQEKPYQRKFVPGALPSLPSERFYENDTAAAPDTDTNTAEPGPLAVMSGNVQRGENRGHPSHGDHLMKASARSTPKKASSASYPESPSRKRKSPEHKSVRDKAPQDQAHAPGKENPDERLAHAEEPNTPRKATKMGKSDSPGSVERKRSQSEERPLRDHYQYSPRRRSNTRSPSTRRRSTSRSRTTPCLRMKKGRSDLRSASTSHISDHDMHGTTPNDISQPPLYPFMQQLLDVDPDALDASIAAPTPTSTPSRDYHPEPVPPVPPLPKNLAATAAKVDRRLAREIWKLRTAHMASSDWPQPSEEDFRWPEGFF